jgi:hypothetical protein
LVALAAQKNKVTDLAYAMLGRYAQEVLFLTPFIVLLGTGGVAADTVGLALQRILATLLGTALAGGIALALARADRDNTDDTSPATGPADSTAPGATDAPGR